MAHLTDPAKITSRSNSDLTTVDLILNETGLAPEIRMDLIAMVSREWFKNAGESAQVKRRRISVMDFYKRLVHRNPEQK